MKMRTSLPVILFVFIMLASLSSCEHSSMILFPDNVSLQTSSDSGVSNYTINNYVTYDIEINMSLVQQLGNADYFFKYPRLNNRHPNNSLTRYCAPYQESELLYHETNGYNDILEDHNDRFNNTFDSFNVSISGSGSASYSQKYRTTLNAISFSGIQDSDIGEYDKSDIMFELYCNHSQEHYEKDALQTVSDNIVTQSDNPIEKAQKIIQNVTDHLVYNGSMTEEKGALWAYNNREGDCSEYTDLMVTLLRGQGIPARKVSGWVLSNYINERPQVGDEYYFSTSPEIASEQIKGHAWVEYYVPNIGWIQCDPTWHESSANYFNNIDYLRLNFNIGQWFFYPPDNNVSEIGHPRLYYQNSSATDLTYEYELTATVIDTDVIPLSSEDDDDDGNSKTILIPMDLIIIIAIGFGVALIALIALILIIKNKNR
ncbi:MAG: hypothetical protein GF353_28775 [Candidatus Lokiarchaeota archaeon]|nr:hypothetical protein [Candidatus Lokiarchaeota archaeon]